MTIKKHRTINPVFICLNDNYQLLYFYGIVVLFLLFVEEFEI